MFLKDFLRGGVAPLFGSFSLGVKLELAEKNLSHLHGGCYVEPFAGKFVYLFLYLLFAYGELHRKRVQFASVYAHSCPFHVGQHACQGEFYVVYECQLPVFL